MKVQETVPNKLKSLTSSLEEILCRRVPDTDGPGVQVVVVSPDQVLFEGAVGLANPVVDPNEKVTTSHQANLYSVSKFFTACCLIKLIQQGKLSNTDQVQDYLPTNLQKLVTNGCTVEQLLTHVGGAPNPLPLQWVHTPDEIVDDTELLAKILEKNPFKPLSKRGVSLPYQYSNVGYWVLGHVVTTACNAQPADFAQCCHELLFPKLSQDEANRIVSDQFSADAPMAHGHVPRWSMLALVAQLACPKNMIGPKNRSWMRMEPHLPNGTAYGGLIASSRSMSIFLQSLLGGSVLSSVEPLFTPRTSKMTFGLHIRPHRGVRIYHKEGGGAGSHSSIQFRKGDLVGIIISGDATFDVNGLLDELMDCIEDYEHQSRLRVPQTTLVTACDGTKLFTKRNSADPKVVPMLGNEAVLLICGGPGVPDYLQEVASLLINSNITPSVISFDQRGVGQSRLPAGGQISIDLLLDDIESIRKANNIERIHILGHSWGGVLAQLYAKRFHDCCASLVLLSPTTVSQASDWPIMELQVMKYNKRKGGWVNFAKLGLWSLLMYVPLVSDFAARKVMKQVMKNYYFDPSSSPDPPEEFLNGVSANALIMSKKDFMEKVKERIEWDGNKTPSYCVFGDEDIYGRELISSFCERFKGKKDILQQCSHLEWIDQPKQLEFLLKGFYSGITSS